MEAIKNSKISHDLADAGGLLLLLLEQLAEGVEAELLGHEELELEAEVHVVVDLLELAVLPQCMPEVLAGELGLHELLDLDEAELLLGLLELVLDEGEHLQPAELLLDALPVGLDLGVQEGLLDLGPLLVVQARLDRHQLDPLLELERGGREHGHVVREGLEALHVLKTPLGGGLVEEHGEDLQVVVAEGVRADVELALVERDAGLVEDHEQLLEAVVVGQQLWVAVNDAQLLVALLLHLEGQHLCAQPEVAPRLQGPPLLAARLPPLPSLPPRLVAVVEAHLALPPAVRRVSLFEGAASELGVDGHLAVLAAVLAGQLRALNSAHGNQFYRNATSFPNISTSQSYWLNLKRDQGNAEGWQQGELAESLSCY